MTGDRPDAGSITDTPDPGSVASEPETSEPETSGPETSGPETHAPPPSRQAAWSVPPLRVVLVGLGVTAVLTIVAIAANSEPLTFSAIESTSSRTTTDTRSYDLGPADQGAIEELPNDEPAEPIEIPRFVLIALGVVAGAVALYYLSLQRLALRLRKPPITLTPTIPTLTAEEEAEEIVKFTRDLIDELGQGDDPRVAIQRAYAAVETGFGSSDLERKPAETPLKYLERALGQNTEVTEPLRTITSLFEIARFSPKAIDESMRTDAIAALSVIRDSYQRQASDASRG